MVIKGEVEKIIFRNAENGYTVIDLSCSGESVTAVGIFAEIYEGAVVEIAGDYRHHTKHGIQFAADEVKILPPDNAESVQKFLKSGLFRGIGEVTAERIVQKFGADALKIMEKSPLRLAEVRGISKAKATEFGKMYAEKLSMRETLIFLQRFDMSLNFAVKIYKQYGDATEKVIKDNPYRLIEDVDRVGFITADKIAREIGVEETSEFRIRAAIIYLLKEAGARMGHTYLPQDRLIADTLKLLNFTDDFAPKIISVIEDMVMLTDLKKLNAPDSPVMLYKTFVAEQRIAARLTALQRSFVRPAYDVSDEISKFETTNKIELHENQRSAVQSALAGGVQIITGGPGTGKTTIIKCILSVLNNQNLKCGLCAPTGRAAKRMSEATGKEAKTIHRLLDLDFKDGKGYFTFNEKTRLPFDMVIVDEVSMVDENMFGALLSAIERGAGLVLVGDKDQLPSVGAGNVLADLIESGVFGVACLTHIYRQAAQSLIITNAHRINNGQMPVLDDVKGDFFFENISEPQEVLSTVVELCKSRLPKYLNCDSSEIQVLCPMKRGVAGVAGLNKELRDALNPYETGEEMQNGDYTFRVGDKVMQTVNNYDLEWRQYCGVRVISQSGVFNGEIGYITAINRDDMSFTVRFEDDKVAVYSFGDLDQIVPAYAVSVHKSQGSEYGAVVLALTAGNRFLLTRNLLYTAVTRAKKLVVIVGTREIVSAMVRNNYTAKRYTFLKQLLLRAQSGEGDYDIF